MIKEFPLGTVLSVTTGRLLCDLLDLYSLLDHMTDDKLMTHQLPRAADVCGPALLAQHPALRTVTVPEGLDSEDKCRRWLDIVSVRLGDELPVEPLEAWQHRDPLDELFEMRGGKLHG